MCRTWGPLRPRSSSWHAPSSSKEVGGGHAALTCPFWPDLGPATAFFFSSMKLGLGPQLWRWCPRWTLLNGGLPQIDLWGVGRLLLKIVIELHVDGGVLTLLEGASSELSCGSVTRCCHCYRVGVRAQAIPWWPRTRLSASASQALYFERPISATWCFSAFLCMKVLFQLVFRIVFAYWLVRYLRSSFSNPQKSHCTCRSGCRKEAAKKVDYRLWSDSLMLYLGQEVIRILT